MPRVDYFNDPNAPRANSIVPAVSVVVPDATGAILMVRRSDNNLWSIPGGEIEIGESIIDAAKREVGEETGILIDVDGLVGVYSDPQHVSAYDDGEVRQQFSICLAGLPVGGELRPSNETTEVSFVPAQNLAGLDIHPSIRLRIRHFLEGPRPYVG